MMVIDFPSNLEQHMHPGWWISPLKLENYNLSDAGHVMFETIKCICFVALYSIAWLGEKMLRQTCAETENESQSIEEYSCGTLVSISALCPMPFK